LHISKEEQRKRLEERMNDPSEQWKASESDITERNSGITILLHIKILSTDAVTYGHLGISSLRRKNGLETLW